MMEKWVTIAVRGARFGRQRSRNIFAGICLLAGCAVQSAGAAEQGQIKTVTPGVLTVAIASYMPYAGLVDGKLSGLDGDIITAVARRLGLTVKPALSDFAGTLAAVQANRADVAVGSVGWTEARAKAGLFTDSPYYSDQIVLVRNDAKISKIEDLEGLTVATGIGYSYIPAIQAIPGAKLKTYPTPANMLQDLLDKRVDAVFTDALVNVAYAKEHPGMLKAAAMTPPTPQQLAEHPDYKYLFPRPSGFYLNKNNKPLEEAMTKIIRSFYADGTIKQSLIKWGADPDRWMTPSSDVKDRIGADRPKDWYPPPNEVADAQDTASRMICAGL